MALDHRPVRAPARPGAAGLPARNATAVELLRRDAATLYRAAIRLEIRAVAGEVIALSDLGAGDVRRRLALRGYEARHLRFTEGFLDKLEARITLHPDALRTQAWWLDVAAENAAVWIHAPCWAADR